LCAKTCPFRKSALQLLAVGDPDVFDLDGVIEEPAAFALLGVEPINRTPFVSKDLL